MGQSEALLDIEPGKLVGYQDALGVDGLGVFTIPGALTQTALSDLQAEISDPELVVWCDNHD